jgi:hypothetical protein
VHVEIGLTEHLACRLFPPYTFVPPVRRHGLQVELTKLSQSSSPNDWPAGHAIHVSFAFQSSTLQADRKAKLYVYGRPVLQSDCGSSGAPALTIHSLAGKLAAAFAAFSLKAWLRAFTSWSLISSMKARQHASA